MNRFADRRTRPQSTRIADFCNTLSGFADFESSADHGLAENFNLARIPDSSGMSESVDRGY